MRRTTRAPALLLALVALVLSVVVAAPAQSFSQAAFPLVRIGARGVDVQALQYLLQARGYSVSADGVFGSGTEGVVKTFQSRNGLTPDGAVGAGTWGKLVVQVQMNSSGAAVKALQAQLNSKRRLSLAVDGEFGSGTRSAVTSFQSHAGVTADGVVGPTTWRNLLWHYAYPSFSSLCDQDPDGNGTANWGTGSTIGAIEKAARDFAATGQGKVPLGDVSFEHGGDIPGHASHEVGQDVDLWPIRTDSAQCTGARITWQSSTYDRAATRQLLQLIRAASGKRITLIYFNDPTLIREGLCQSYPNHDNHLHVRFT